MSRYSHGNDSCLSIWADAYGSGSFDFPQNARVLEIGCAEADWMTPMLALRPDLKITGIDWRGCDRPAPVVQGDVLTTGFTPKSFDCVVGVSSIEHIGLGHYKADPLHVNGDSVCMERVVEWLKPGGWVYFDVPWNPLGYEVHGTSHRTYDEQALQQRLLVPGLKEVHRWYATHAGRVVPSLEPQALPHFDYIAILATKV